MVTFPANTVACGVTISSFNVSAMVMSAFLTLGRGPPPARAGARSLRSRRLIRGDLLRSHLFDPALHVEVPLGHAVVLAVEDLLEAADRVLDRDLSSFATGEDLRRAEGLAQEALNLPRPEHG